MSKRKIGIMGAGIVADFNHIPAIQASNAWEVAAVFDPDPVKLRKVQNKCGIDPAICHGDVDSFFRDGGFEAVSITSPAPTHHANALLAARHGKHVLCEKPMAMNAEEGRAMLAAAAAAKVQFWMGLVCRFTPVAQKIRELVRQKAIGEVRALRLVFNWACHGRYKVDDETGEYGINKRREGRMAEGGPLVDCGPHEIDLACWWLGSPIIRQEGFGAWVEDGYAAPDHVWLHLDHANGAHTMIETSFAYGHTSKEKVSEYLYELIGTDGVIRYDRGQKTLAVHGKDADYALPTDEDRGFRAMYDEFARAIESGHSELLASGAEGLELTRVSRLATEEAINKHGLLRREK
ncbi:MAG: Gfo/Idh/MocA family oxidoreductase [Planctomycetes bacterium]|nr:Gfo/Idh/MocA family oxidoreductase [Planctomycetota bacterium]